MYAGLKAWQTVECRQSPSYMLQAFFLQYCLNPFLAGRCYILAYKLDVQSGSVHAVSFASILVQLVGSCE